MIRGYNHKHPERKDMSCAIFPHLHSPQLRVRLPMVAWWMQINAPRRILEIGPSSNPIYPHLDAARAARVMAIVPASANAIARLAHGLADDVVAESALALAGQLLIAPAMNHRMWLHPATLRNVATLRQDGVHFIDPDTGDLACGYQGIGRRAAVDAILNKVNELLGRQ